MVLVWQASNGYSCVVYFRTCSSVLFISSNEVEQRGAIQWRSAWNRRLLGEAWLGPERAYRTEYMGGGGKLICMVQESNGHRGEVTGEWRSPWIADYIAQLGLAQKFQRAKQMGRAGREAYLYDSGI